MTWLGDLGSTILGVAYAFRVALAIVSVLVVVVVAILARRNGWIGGLRRHPRATAVVLVALLAVALPVGWYLASPLVLSASIDEPAPSVLAVAGSPRLLDA